MSSPSCLPGERGLVRSKVCVGAFFALSANSDEGLNPAAEAAADLPTVTDCLDDIVPGYDECKFNTSGG